MTANEHDILIAALAKQKETVEGSAVEAGKFLEKVGLRRMADNASTKSPKDDGKQLSSSSAQKHGKHI